MRARAWSKSTSGGTGTPVPERAIEGGNVVRTTEEVVVSFLRYRNVEHLAVVLDAVRIQVGIRRRAGVASCLVGPVHHTSGNASELGSLVRQRVRSALMESRSAYIADADVREHVARRHKITARDTQHAEGVAIVLVHRIHVAELDRTEGAVQTDKRVPIRKCAGAGLQIDLLLDLPNRL